MISFRTILESIASAIEALPTTLYQWDSTDAWTRSRTTGPLGDDAHHLEFRIDLGQPRMNGTVLVFDSATIEYVSRAGHDDDFTSQGRILDSALDVFTLLATWGLPAYGARTLPDTWQILEADSELTRVRIPFTLTIVSWRA